MNKSELNITIKYLDANKEEYKINSKSHKKYGFLAESIPLEWDYILSDKQICLKSLLS